MLDRQNKKKINLLFLPISFLLIGNLPILGYAESFDREYEKWKAQQLSHDQRLQARSDHYLARPTEQKGLERSTASTQKIRLNHASVLELQSLTGVGEKKAQAIIEYRKQQGGFKHVEEFKSVKGIGEKLYEKNKARLAL